MKLINFDGAFEAYLQDWFMRSKGLFRTYDEMEDQVPEVYQTFLDTPADFLNGQKPGEFFERFSDPAELTDWMVAYEQGRCARGRADERRDPPAGSGKHGARGALYPLGAGF